MSNISKRLFEARKTFGGLPRNTQGQNGRSRTTANSSFNKNSMSASFHLGTENHIYP